MKLACDKEEFASFCRLLYQRGLVSGVGGNVSFRTEEGILVTPSGISLRDITADNLVLVDINGTPRGEIAPTKDVGFHIGIMKQREEINCVCHVHGEYIIAASAILRPGDNSLPPLTPGFVYYAYPLAMLPFMIPGSIELERAVAGHFSKKDVNALMLQNHGLISAGCDLQEALNIAEEVNEVARIFLLIRGEGNVLGEDQIASIKLLRKKRYQ